MKLQFEKKIKNRKSHTDTKVRKFECLTSVRVTNISLLFQALITTSIINIIIVIAVIVATVQVLVDGFHVCDVLVQALDLAVLRFDLLAQFAPYKVGVYKDITDKVWSSLYLVKFDNTNVHMGSQKLQCITQL